MPSRIVSGRMALIAAAAALAIGLSACTSFSAVRTQGYDLKEDALVQVRPGQSQDLVALVLGSPQTTNNFGTETAWYYIETKVNQTSFGLTTVQERTVVAVYFDKNKRVVDKAVYGLRDGKQVTIEQRRTPSYGEDRNFIQTIMSSFGG